MIDSILKEAKWIGKTSAQDESLNKEIQQYRRLLNRMRNKNGIKKLPALLESAGRLRKPDLYWGRTIDKSEPAHDFDVQNFLISLKLAIRRKLPIAVFIRKILKFGLARGPMVLNRVLEKGRVRFEILKVKDNEEKTPPLDTAQATFEEKDTALEERKKSLFGGEPTPEQLAKLKADKDVFKEYMKARAERTQAKRQVRESFFAEEKQDSVDVDTYREKMKGLKVEVDFDEKFKGMVDKDGKLRTASNRLLLSPMGRNVTLNPDYDEAADNTYYCTSVNRNGNLVHHYTLDYALRHKKEKYAKNVQFGESIGDIRNHVNEDLDSEDPKKKTMALMVTLIDQAYFRIGNKGSEKKKDVRGLHNLQVKHLKFDDKGRMHFKYTGKDGIHQHKVIGDEKITAMMKQLVEGKKPRDYIFTYDVKGKTKPVNPGDINRYMKDDLHAPVTIHKFRTYHATRMAKEMLDVIKVAPKVVAEKIMKAFNKVVGSIAKLMGHTDPGTTMRHYIDSHVLKDFFDKFALEPPKGISDMLVTASVDEDGYVKVVSDKTLTPEEEKFNNWMGSLGPEMIESEEIDVPGKDNEEEKYFL